ncbi:hypothetical protein K458DRAFT_381270 [Lentithecium fluviatile CBS 122367]|uniref:Uncharacterized protein n=1 Tax=Lentithecium fluviatile CBS 122367 TaxID=1168545 RepID=A0A6G1JLG5_9PLEO|nr:hypothetical protein K458DRAFT_381270 [Lentithecium fluviatile CBS 122367]
MFGGYCPGGFFRQNKSAPEHHNTFRPSRCSFSPLCHFSHASDPQSCTHESHAFMACGSLRRGGDSEPPPDPQIPVNCQQKPRRQPPLPSSHLPPPPVSVDMPEWIPPTSASDGENVDREVIGRPGRSISSVAESAGSTARSRSPTLKMVDIKGAEKMVPLKMMISPADVPEDVQELYTKIQSLAHIPRGVIPLGVEVRAYSQRSLLSAHSWFWFSVAFASPKFILGAKDQHLVPHEYEVLLPIEFRTTLTA